MPARFEVDGRALNLTIRNFRGTLRDLRRAEATAAGLAGSKMLAAIKANIGVPAIGGSARAHRNALRRMDHPYAARHGSIRYRPPAGGSKGFRRRELLVHSVTGQLKSAVSGRLVTRSGRASFEITTDLGKAPHLRYVLGGTRFMLPRDVLWETAQDPEVRREMLRAIVFVFGRVFRSQAHLRLV